MKHPETFIVTEDDSRGRQRGPQCFYCPSAIGSEHASECVCRQRSVVIQVTITYPILVPESWPARTIEFHRNDGSWCSSNLLEELDALDSCLCPLTEFKFVREAGEEDRIALQKGEG